MGSMVAGEDVVPRRALFLHLPLPLPRRTSKATYNRAKASPDCKGAEGRRITVGTGERHRDTLGYPSPNTHPGISAEPKASPERSKEVPSITTNSENGKDHS